MQWFFNVLLQYIFLKNSLGNVLGNNKSYGMVFQFLHFMLPCITEPSDKITKKTEREQRADISFKSCGRGLNYKDFFLTASKSTP